MVAPRPQDGPEHAIPAHARALTWIIWGFWITVFNVPLIGYALMLVGVWRLRSASAQRERHAAAARFTLTFAMMLTGGLIALAADTPRAPPLVPSGPAALLLSIGGFADTLAGWIGMSALALLCAREGAQHLARSWTLSARWWLLVYLPLDVIGLVALAATGSPLRIESLLAFVLVFPLMLAPVVRAHVSAYRMSHWRPMPIIRDCPQCGYSLAGLPGPQCPECGLPFDAMGGEVWTASRSHGAPLRS